MLFVDLDQPDLDLVVIRFQLLVVVLQTLVLFQQGLVGVLLKDGMDVPGVAESQQDKRQGQVPWIPRWC